MLETERSTTHPRVWKRIILIVGLVLAVLISLSLIVHIPAIQQWGIKKFTSYLTQKTGSAVSVSRFDFNAFSHFNLKDVYFSQKDTPQDTLLYAGELGVRFSKLWKLFSGSPDINQVRLRDAKMYIDDRPITFLAISGKKKSKSAGVRIVEPEIVLDNVFVRVSKKSQKLAQEFFLTQGTIEIDEINSELKILRIASIRIEDPVVLLNTKPDSLFQRQDSAILTTRDTSTWTYEIQKLDLANGKFRFLQTDAKNPFPSEGINYDDLQISDLHVDLRDFCIDDGRVVGRIHELNFAEQSGFKLEHVEARRLELTSKQLALGGLEVRTGRSMIMDSIVVDFGTERPISFADKANLYLRFEDSKLAIQDLLTTVPQLRTSKFFLQNRNEVFDLDGVLKGTVDRLRGDSLYVQLGKMSFAGQFRSRDLTAPGKQVLNLVVSDARFTPDDLEKHIPGVNFPEQFTKLGRMQFNGQFDGFFQDFVAYGRLNTDLGSAEVDMNLKTKDKVPTYDGELSLQQFNLQKWTDINDLGLVSANLKLRNGTGLTPETAVADIAGSIDLFQYKGYTYTDAQVDGRLNQNQFDGKLSIDDPNIALTFQGSVINRNDIPVFDFTADINHLDLKKLNLSQERFSLNGVFAAQGQGNDLNSLKGALRAADVEVVRGEESYALDTMFIDIDHDADGRRIIHTNSDYVNGWVIGDFELNSLYPSLARFLEESYPRYFRNLKYRKDLSNMKSDTKFDVTLNRPEEWGGLVNLRDMRFRNLQAKGLLNFEKDSVIIDIVAPEFHYGNVNIYMTDAHLSSLNGKADVDLYSQVIDIDERYFFDQITTTVQTTDTGFIWSLSADDLLEELNTLGVSGTFSLDSANQIYTVHVDPQIIEVLEQKWELLKGNRIRFGKEFIELRDIVFRHEDQVISVTDIENRGVMVETQHFNLDVIDEIWDYDKLDFSGPYTLRASLGDVFAKDEFFLSLTAPQVLVNGDNYGELRLNCRMDQLGAPISLYVGMDYTGVHLSAGGSYYPPIKEVAEPLRNTLDVDVQLDTFPLHFLEYFLKGGVRNTAGYAVGDMNVSGKLGKTKMDGDAIVYEGATTISYLGTRYFFHEQPVHITESVIDATGLILRDELGNVATVTGGLTHRALGRMGLNTQISSPRILALNTTKADNSTYYGKGIGSVIATFRGLLDRPTISIVAITTEGTYIVINLADESAAREKSFLTFRGDATDGHVDLSKKTSITGMNFEMNMTATPDAVVEIILEDDPPESIVGSGTGDIQMEITRTGDFTMYGQYEIEQGSYLFRSFFVINKPFSLRRGGTIQWTGDPYNADINIEADYVGLRASLSTFLAEYLTTDIARQEASAKTDVYLRLLLTGTLLEPVINFDLSFPNLSGELAGYADTKLRVLKANQNAMNEQVFGLLWAGSFLPSNILQSESSLQLAEQGITNTMSEFLSSQFSSVLSNAVSQWIGDEIDFDVNYSQASQFDYPTNEGSATYREWEVRVKNRIFNDRVIIDAGANYSTDSPIGGAYLVGDYALEYLLTQDGRLKVRFYHRNEYTIEGRKNKLGIGLAWRREFDSFDEWLGGLKKSAENLKEEQ